jgi:hypothetical protein
MECASHQLVLSHGDSQSKVIHCTSISSSQCRWSTSFSASCYKKHLCWSKSLCLRLATKTPIAIDPLVFSPHFQEKNSTTRRVLGGLPDRQWKTREKRSFEHPIPLHRTLPRTNDIFDKRKNDNTLSTIIYKWIIYGLSILKYTVDISYKDIIWINDDKWIYQQYTSMLTPCLMSHCAAATSADNEVWSSICGFTRRWPKNHV